MASIVDSIRSVYQETFSLLKLGLFSGVIFLFFSPIMTSYSFNIIVLLFVLCIIYFYLGFSCQIINNRISQNIQTLPAIDIFHFINVATKAFVIAIPYVAVAYFLSNLVVKLFTFQGVPQLVALWVIRYFILSFMFTALINFSNKFELKDGMDFSKITSGVADVLVYTLVSMLILSVLSVFIVGPTLNLVYKIYGVGPLFQYVAIFFFTSLVAIVSDYWGQLHYDIESRNNYY